MSVAGEQRGSWRQDRMSPALLLMVAILTVVTGYDPPGGRLNWFLEVSPGLAGIAVIVALHRRFPMSRLVHVCVFLHMLVLFYGGYYTYAETPLGNWVRDALGLARNHYDRVGHLALGFFPALIIREALLRCTPLRRGGWLYFIVTSIATAIGAFWEILEWWTTLIVASDVGEAFLGAQGDPWDAQWDMFLVMAGAMVAQPLLGRMHDRSMAHLEPEAEGRGPDASPNREHRS